jgi:hypothetical protein
MIWMISMHVQDMGWTGDRYPGTKPELGQINPHPPSVSHYSKTTGYTWYVDRAMSNLKSWVYAIFAGVLSVAALQNVTIDDLDRSIVVSPLRVWSWSDEGTGKINNTFSFSNDGTASVVFTFPGAVSHVSEITHTPY